VPLTAKMPARTLTLGVRDTPRSYGAAQNMTVEKRAVSRKPTAL